MKRNISPGIHLLILISIIAALVFLPSVAKAALGVSGVTPNTISNQQNNSITLTGNDFVLGAVVSLDGYGALNTSYFSNTSLMAVVPAGIPTGLYTLTITNPDLSTVSLPNSVTIG